MGYTTTFKGKFSFNRLPSSKTIQRLSLAQMQAGRDVGSQAPDSYCQWKLTKDFMGIEWDQGEKFYKYIEWLQWIIDHILTPDGITLSGSVTYWGEDAEDRGTITVLDRKIHVTVDKPIGDSIDELTEFRNFVLDRDDRQLLLDWLQHKERKDRR